MTLSHQEPSCIQYTFKRKKRRGFPSAMEVRLTKAWSDAITEKKSKLTWKGRVSLICFFSLNTGSSTRHFGPKTGCQEPKLYSVLEYEAWRMLCLPIVLQAWIAQKWNIFAGSPTNKWEKIKNLRKSQSFLGSKLAWKTEVPRESETAIRLEGSERAACAWGRKAAEKGRQPKSVWSCTFAVRGRLWEKEHACG